MMHFLFITECSSGLHCVAPASWPRAARPNPGGLGGYQASILHGAQLTIHFFAISHEKCDLQKGSIAFTLDVSCVYVSVWVYVYKI